MYVMMAACAINTSRITPLAQIAQALLPHSGLACVADEEDGRGVRLEHPRRRHRDHLLAADQLDPTHSHVLRRDLPYASVVEVAVHTDCKVREPQRLNARQAFAGLTTCHTSEAI